MALKLGVSPICPDLNTALREAVANTTKLDRYMVRSELERLERLDGKVLYNDRLQTIATGLEKVGLSVDEAVSRINKRYKARHKIQQGANKIFGLLNAWQQAALTDRHSLPDLRNQCVLAIREARRQVEAAQRIFQKSA